jgi:hypothetical protein
MGKLKQLRRLRSGTTKTSVIDLRRNLRLTMLAYFILVLVVLRIAFDVA